MSALSATPHLDIKITLRHLLLQGLHQLIALYCCCRFVVSAETLHAPLRQDVPCQQHLTCQQHHTSSAEEAWIL